MPGDKAKPYCRSFVVFFVGHANKTVVVHCHSLDSSTKAGDLPLVTSSDPYRQSCMAAVWGKR